MHILITGAAGFVGQALVRRLLRTNAVERADSATTITLLDVSLETVSDSRVRVVEGNLTDPELLADAVGDGVDTVYHLASVPGGAAERDYALGRAVNLDGTARLIELCEGQRQPPRFVFASSIAVYGDSFPAFVDESTPPRPATSYGTQKLIGEFLVSDATRRGWIDGCSLRLPGVVARPPGPSGLVSAFMSEIFWAMRDGIRITLPVSPSATAWWISRERCVDNLLHAGTISSDRMSNRTFLMPVLRLSVGQILESLAQRFGSERLALVDFNPDSRVEALFGSYPPLATPLAELAGFRSDSDVREMFERIFETHVHDTALGMS